MTESTIENCGFRPQEDKNGFKPSNKNQSSSTRLVNQPKPKIILSTKVSFEVNASNEFKDSDIGIFESILENKLPWFILCYPAKMDNDTVTKKFALRPFVSRYIQALNENETRQTIEKIEPKQFVFESLPFTDMERSSETNIDDTMYSIPDVQNLFSRIELMLKNYVDMSRDFINLCSLMVLMSYEQHKFNWVPYLGIFGDTGSGKSVLTELMSFLCYHCGYFTQANSADIYQFLSEFEGTIPTFAEDETQGMDKDFDKMKIYKSGNSKNGKVPRILQTNDGRKFLSFPTFCFKILAGEQIPTVKGLNERTLTINMSKGKPQKNWYFLTDNERNEIKKLKWDLLKWRLANYENRYPTGTAITRIENNLYPLRAIAKGLIIEHDFENWCNDAIAKSQNAKKATIEGCVSESIFNVITANNFEAEKVLQGEICTRIYIDFEVLWIKFKDLTNAKIDNFQTDKMHTVEFGEVTKNKIGRILTDIFNSKTMTITKDKQKVRCREFTVETLLRVLSNYHDEQEVGFIKNEILKAGQNTSLTFS